MASRDRNKVPSDDEIKDALHQERLICVDVDENNSKYWHGYVLANGDFYCEYGRVDITKLHDYYDYGSESAALAHLNKKTKSKMAYSGKKAAYTRQQTINNGLSKTSSVGTSNIAAKAVADIGGCKEVQTLITWLAQMNVHTITSNTTIVYNADAGTFSTPLGLVTSAAINDARGILDDLSKFVVKKGWEDDKYKKLLGDYLRLIPQRIPLGTRTWHRDLLKDKSDVAQQADILDSLSASLTQATTTTDGDKKTEEKLFDVKLEVVDSSNIFKRLKDKYHKSKRDNHHQVRGLDLRKVWSVDIPCTKSAFDKHGKKIGNVMELFHGTKPSNLLSILKVGLVIPPATAGHCTDRLYGDGAYASSISTKALNYATSFWGGNDEGRYFMLIVDMAMGKTYVPHTSGWGDGGSGYPKKGYDSTWAKANVSGVYNDECIVYKTSQVNIKFLLEFGR